MTVVPRSIQEDRAEVKALKAALVDGNVNVLNLCSELRDQALARGDEATAWKVSKDAAAITAAIRAARGSLDRYLEHIEAAAQS